MSRKRDPSKSVTREDIPKPVEADFQSIRETMSNVSEQIRVMGLGLQADLLQSASSALKALQSRVESA